MVAYCFSPSEKTDEQAVEETLASYSALVGQPVNSSIVQDFNRWQDNFPRVATDSMNAGFYQQLDTFQGRFRQYYAGALFSFEMVKEAVEHDKYIVERFF